MIHPVVANDVVGRPFRPVAHRRQDLVRGMPAVKRRDHRLNDRGGPVERARITPGFEKMRLRNLPLAPLRCFVRVEAQVDSRLHLASACTNGTSTGAV